MAVFSIPGVAIVVLALGLASTARANGGADDGADSNGGASAYVRCAACHLADGSGVPGAFPPLAGRLGGLTASDAGRDYLVMVVKSGLMGAMEVDGVPYQGVMSAQATGLDDAGVAALLNYTMTEFNSDGLPGDWQPFSAAEVTSIAARYPGANPMSVYKLRGPAFAPAEGK
jgi:mono/diheme cytochrome c family protein